MGKGKGAPEYWVARGPSGNICSKLDGVPESVAKESFVGRQQACRSAPRFQPPPRSRRGPSPFQSPQPTDAMKAKNLSTQQ